MADRSYLDWPFFDEIHRHLARDLDAWAGAELAPDPPETNVDDRCRHLVERLAASGWLVHAVAGMGGRSAKLAVRSLCLVRETLARHDGLADFAFAMQGLGSGAISLFGSEALCAEYLPDVAAGRRIAGFALSEPDAGSDVAAITTTARPNRRGLRPRRRQSLGIEWRYRGLLSTVFCPHRRGAGREGPQRKATVCFSTPLAYRAMLSQASSAELSSLTKCVSAGETLPVPVFQAWEDASGIRIIDGIGATEMLHIFISSPESEIRPGATGRVVPGYKARVLDDDGRPLPTGSVGRLAVRGPTGCRYLADERQKDYVFDGWNVTGDAYRMDEDGYFWFQARADDMIVSAGYNIAGPEVEAVLLEHPGVAECAVVAAPDTERGHIVKAFVIAAQDRAANADLAAELQDFVKQRIAPYKYPRAVEFLDALPKSGTGKIQRFVLRQREVELARAAPGHAEQA